MYARDELFWPGGTFWKDAIDRYQPVWRNPGRSEDNGRIAAIVAAFCPELDCLRGSCFEHRELITATSEERALDLTITLSQHTLQAGTL